MFGNSRNPLVKVLSRGAPSARNSAPNHCVIARAVLMNELSPDGGEVNNLLSDTDDLTHLVIDGRATEKTAGRAAEFKKRSRQRVQVSGRAITASLQDIPSIAAHPGGIYQSRYKPNPTFRHNSMPS